MATIYDVITERGGFEHERAFSALAEAEAFFAAEAEKIGPPVWLRRIDYEAPDYFECVVLRGCAP